ncbi:hypothetical protein KZX50_26235 [Bacillus infantis]|uniref:hypothetical protein n=1 Tax=Bacillus infantis TaxID=324767 RepID=UPI00200498BF|nr:hypothetical protein [Bacillus infantis]MCK6208911.1 hypothetical protein [Bacillus infantis]
MLKLKKHSIGKSWCFMGRPRKPFMEKSTNIFLNLSNEKIAALLDCYGIEYEVPELTWDSSTLNELVSEIDKLLDENIKNCKKRD